MKHFTLLLLFFTSLCASAQYLNWAKQISGPGVEYVKAMTTDASGNIYTAGYFTGTIDFDPGAGVSNSTATGQDAYFAKYTSTGNFLWARVITGSDADVATDIALDNANNIYVTFHSNSNATPIDLDPGAGVQPGALTYSGNNGFVAKYTSNGNYVWNRIIGGTGNDITKPNAIAVDGSGNVYVGGSIMGSSVTVFFSGSVSRSTINGSIFYAKYNTSGTLQWATNLGASNQSASANDIVLSGTSLYVTGFYTGTISSLNSISGSAFIAKVSTSTGGLTWFNRISGTQGDCGEQIVADGSGNPVVTGYLNTSGYNIFLAKLPSGNGLPLWFRNIDAANEDQAQSLAIDGIGNIYMAGYVTGIGNSIFFGTQPLNLPNNDTDLYLSKYDANGFCIWARNLDMALSGGTTVNEVNALRYSNGNLIMAGNFSGNGDFDACASTAILNSNTTDGFIGSYFPDQPIFSAPDWLCNTQSYAYAVSGLPPGALVNWSVSPSGLVTPTSGSGPIFVVTPIANASGYITVTATITGYSCPIGPFSSTNFVGKPTVSYNPGGPNYCHDSPLYTVVPQLPGVGYFWEVNNSNVWFTSTNGFPNSQVISVYPEVFDLTVTLTGLSCSVTIVLPDEISPGYYCDCFEDQAVCGDQNGGAFGLTFGPNPSTDYLDLSLKETPKRELSVLLFDKMGNKTIEQKMSDKSLRIQANSLPEGVYFLQITDGNVKDIFRVMIER